MLKAYRKEHKLNPFNPDSFLKWMFDSVLSSFDYQLKKYVNHPDRVFIARIAHIAWAWWANMAIDKMWWVKNISKSNTFSPQQKAYSGHIERSKKLMFITWQFLSAEKLINIDQQLVWLDNKKLTNNRLNQISFIKKYSSMI